jgi:DNA-binding MarR family transcriptional regulator
MAIFRRACRETADSAWLLLTVTAVTELVSEHLNHPVIDMLGSMTEGAQGGAGEPSVEWLTAAEVHSWLSVVRLMTWLPWSIDQQLQRDSNLGMVEYQVLAMLSDRPERTMRMSSLAEVTNASLSRLSHLVKRLEGRGLVRREPDPADGRFTNAILTDKGFQTLAEAAPGHVAHVRSLVIDVLSPEQLRRLGLAADRIMSHIDTSAINYP